MKILLLTDQGSIHAARWANTLVQRGHEIHLATCHDTRESLLPAIRVHKLSYRPPFCYYLARTQLRKLLRDIKPDLLHAHFASGYGTLGRLAGFHPYILSVWGSDVYDFPYRNRWNFRVLKKNLEAADRICSTSHAMAEHTRGLGAHIEDIHITPFGIDVGLFSPDEVQSKGAGITVGTVKTLADKYGIDVLIRAFARARQLIVDYDHDAAALMRLLIVGGGDKRTELETLATELGVGDVTTFAGPVSHTQVPAQLRKLDVYVALSRSESFGVAVLEASASGLPVIVSDVGGLPEVVEDNITGLVVKSENVEEAAIAIKTLVLDPQLRERFGKAGRVHVMKHYEWQSNVTQMESIYKEVLSAMVDKSTNATAANIACGERKL